jgi:hypothetical protein
MSAGTFSCLVFNRWSVSLQGCRTEVWVLVGWRWEREAPYQGERSRLCRLLDDVGSEHTGWWNSLSIQSRQVSPQPHSPSPTYKSIDVPFPKTFINVVKQIFKRLFRVSIVSSLFICREQLITLGICPHLLFTLPQNRFARRRGPPQHLFQAFLLFHYWIQSCGQERIVALARAHRQSHQRRQGEEAYRVGADKAIINKVLDQGREGTNHIDEVD